MLYIVIYSCVTSCAPLKRILHCYSCSCETKIRAQSISAFEYRSPLIFLFSVWEQHTCMILQTRLMCQDRVLWYLVPEVRLSGFMKEPLHSPVMPGLCFPLHLAVSTWLSSNTQEKKNFKDKLQPEVIPTKHSSYVVSAHSADGQHQSGDLWRKSEWHKWSNKKPVRCSYQQVDNTLKIHKYFQYAYIILS